MNRRLVGLVASIALGLSLAGAAGAKAGETVPTPAAAPATNASGHSALGTSAAISYRAGIGDHPLTGSLGDGMTGAGRIAPPAVDGKPKSQPAPPPHVVPKPPRKAGSVAPKLDTAFTLTLTVSPSTVWPTRYTTVTATSNIDVTPTAYFISIYDYEQSRYVAICGVGTVCQANVTSPFATTNTFYAYIASLAIDPNGAATFPPPSQQAQAGPAYATFQSVFVVLAASPANEPVFGEIPLLATTDQDIGPSPFWIMIVDDSTGSVVSACPRDTLCGLYANSDTAITRNYTAYVANWATTVSTMQNIQAVSRVVTVDWFHVCG